MVSEPPDILARLREMRLRYKPTHRTLGRETSTSRTCFALWRKMMMFPAHNIPRQFAISCVESVCLEVTIISCMDGWTSCSSNLQTPSVSMCSTLPDTSCFVEMKMGPMIIPILATENLFEPHITARLAATRQCSVPQCPGDTSQDNYSICQRPQDTRGPHTVHTAPSHGSTTPQW